MRDCPQCVPVANASNPTPTPPYRDEEAPQNTFKDSCRCGDSEGRSKIRTCLFVSRANVCVLRAAGAFCCSRSCWSGDPGRSHSPPHNALNCLQKTTNTNTTKHQALRCLRPRQPLGPAHRVRDGRDRPSHLVRNRHGQKTRQAEERRKGGKAKTKPRHIRTPSTTIPPSPPHLSTPTHPQPPSSSPP